MIPMERIFRDYTQTTKSPPSPLQIALKKRRQRLAQTKLGLDSTQDFIEKEMPGFTSRSLR